MRNINFVFESKLNNFTASGIKRIFCDISIDDYNDDDDEKKTQQNVISLITKLYFLIYLFFLLIREWGKKIILKFLRFIASSPHL